jgi:hypothetical protein
MRICETKLIIGWLRSELKEKKRMGMNNFKGPFAAYTACLTWCCPEVPVSALYKPHQLEGDAHERGEGHFCLREAI